MEHTTQNCLYFPRFCVGYEPSFDASLFCPIANYGYVGASSDHQINCLDQHGLAGTCLTGERSESFIERNTNVLDDSEVLD
jgi:hypothetical protein